MRVPETEAPAVRLAMIASGLALAQHVAARSLRDGLFLSTFSVQQLPRVMVGAALFAIPMALLVTRAMARFGPGRLTPLMFVASACGSLGEWALFPSIPKFIAIAVYLHVSIGGALLVSAFWSIVNERFDPHTLKSVVGRIGGSSTLGGLCGGFMMERAAHWLEPRSTLLLLGALALGAAACTRPLGRGLPSAKPAPPEKAAPASDRLTGYLRTLALLVACSAAVSAFGDFALKQAAAARFANMEALVRFFAVFYTVAALVSFLMQVLVSRRLLDSIGVGGTLSVPPLFSIALGGVALLAPSLITIGALRGCDLALGPSLYRTAFEPLFTPVEAESKRRTKALIDVVFDKGGETLAGALILGVLATSPLLVHRAPLALIVLCGGLAVWLSMRAQRGYVKELEASLRAGTAHATLPDPDQARRLLLSATSLGIDRQKLIDEIARARQARTTGIEAAPPRAAPEKAEQIVSQVRILLGSDVNAILGLLTQTPLDARLAAFVIPHLGRDELAKAAVQALRAMGDAALGVLADAMSSSQLPSVVRRRIPHVLRGVPGERVARSLFWALSTDELDVRYRAALALAEVTREAKHWLPEQQQLEALVLSEIARGTLNRGTVDHLFALLGLGLNRGALELARQGVLSDDRKLRGTALEYLESLLPETIRVPVVSALAEFAGPREALASRPAGAELLEELRRSFQADLAGPALANDPD